MPATGAKDHDAEKINSNASQLPPWRRRLRRFRQRVPLRIRNRSVAMISEFVGTFLFMLIGLGGNSAVINDSAVATQTGGGDPSADPAKILFIATSWGAAVTVNAWSFFRISGGLFNPAVTMALMLIRAVPPLDGLLDIISQLFGSILASAIAYGLLPSGALAATELGDMTTVTQGLFIEMFITAQVVVAVFMLATEKHKATFIAPVGIGLTVFACILMASTYTGAAMNPARSFAVCVIQGSFPHYHWIYWVGPGLGALLATAFYHLIRKLEYWTVNPNVDDYETKVGETIRDVASRVADMSNVPGASSNDDS
ncbi:aquaporin-like protein [Alternaria alternata]|nr:aquaporin-like protein [Alternaria alternata]